MSDEDQFDSEIDGGSAVAETAELGMTAKAGVDDESDDEVLAVGDAAAVMAAKEREREQLRADIDAFLASGGKITNVDNNVVADPPKRPESSYGSQPI